MALCGQRRYFLLNLYLAFNFLQQTKIIYFVIVIVNKTKIDT